MTTWSKTDWKRFYEAARRPWRHHRPPRPVYPTGINRVLPAQGFSLSELDDAGVNLELAERLGLPVDAGRIGTYGPNVTVLRTGHYCTQCGERIEDEVVGPIHVVISDPEFI